MAVIIILAVGFVLVSHFIEGNQPISTKIQAMKGFCVDEVSLQRANVVVGQKFKLEYLGMCEDVEEVKFVAVSPEEDVSQELREMGIGQFLCLIEKQAKGQFGVLVTDGRQNVAWVRNKSGEPEELSVFWKNNFWAITLINDRNGVVVRKI